MLFMLTMLRTVEQSDADVRLVVVSSEGQAMAWRTGIVFEKLKTDCQDLVRSAPLIAVGCEALVRREHLKT